MIRRCQVICTAIALASGLYLNDGRPRGPIEHALLVVGLAGGVIGGLLLTIVSYRQKKANGGGQDGDG